ncbi:DUF4865 family protein [Streptomyces rhizosphaerihabitans]|uniref:DUF4865 family protein n=1 Tax=Streptomyces rhizosphaerihabitans TaxID=1266770 RepID=UPI0021C1C216|nr:DUF4865 family protein [Streptomyces rhizosphaerihabitans]MCT9004568.1 DUF4865 family protein [Streptomyces rhizosphaerihabitans]
MHAMQYEITFPADYDMTVVRDRVDRIGHRLDAWDGLGIKAYLMRERGVDGSPVNQYAPFYLWNTTEGMNSFLWGGAFQGLVNDFGRPVVQHWTGLAYEEGGAAGSPAKVAVRRRRAVDEGLELSEAIEGAVREAGRLAALDGAVCVGAAVDPRHWEVVHFSLWEHDSPKAPGEVFQVLHVSEPERDRLPRGRRW